VVFADISGHMILRKAPKLKISDEATMRDWDLAEGGGFSES
jgi:hypothetical protein